MLRRRLSSFLPLWAAFRGAVAQLGERLNGIQEVVGSIPIGSTKIVARTDIWQFLKVMQILLTRKLPCFCPDSLILA